jgi:hypothetical protein
MAISARLSLVPPPETVQEQVVVVQLLAADAAASTQLPAVGPVVTMPQLVAVWLLKEVAGSGVQDPTGVAAVMMVVSHTVDA